MPPLKNSRHERFAFALFQGMTYTDAALKAGYAVGRARQTGHELVTYSDILCRVQELHEQSETGGVLTVEKRKERLSQIANKDIVEPVRASDVISSIAELNKMTPGVYEPIKVDLSEGLAKLLGELHGNRPQIQESSGIDD